MSDEILIYKVMYVWIFDQD